MSGSLKLSFIIEAIDRATAPVRAVNQRIEKLTEPATRIRSSFNALLRESHLPKLAGQAQEVVRRFDGVTGALRGIAGAALVAGAAATAMWLPMKNVIDAGSKVNDTAAMLGMSAREFQRIAYALTLDGSSAEDAANSLRFLQKNAIEALSGSKEMQLWFRRAGISADFLRKNLNNPIALMERMSDAMAALPTQAQRLALTQALLNRGGMRTAQTLSKGAAELRRLGDEAESLGAVMDEQTVTAMDEAGDSITRMERAIGGLWARITSAALPAIERIVASTTKWAVENRELIATRVGEFVQRLVDNLPQIVDTAWRVIGAIGALILAADAVAQAIGGWQNVIAVIAAVLVGKLVIAIYSLGAALVALIPTIASLGAVLLATPIGWFLGAVALLAGAAYLVYRNWGPISEFFINLWEGVKGAFTDAFEFIAGKIRAVTEFVSGAIVKLDAMTPEWVKRFTLPGAALAAAANAVRPAAASALPAPGAAQANVGGTIGITIDQDGRARVSRLETTNPNVDFDVDAGLLGAAA